MYSVSPALAPTMRRPIPIWSMEGEEDESSLLSAEALLVLPFETGADINFQSVGISTRVAPWL